MESAARQAKTLVLFVALMVIAGFLPAITLGLLGLSNAVNVAILAGLSAFIACMGGTGWRTGLVIAVPFAVLAGLAVWVAPNPWLAALVLAFSAFLRGYAAKAGLHDALGMTVIALGFIVASPPTPEASIAAPLFVAAISLVAMLWATMVMFLLRNRLHRHRHVPLDPIRVLAYSIVLALLVGVATWVVVDRDLGHTGGWVILTIVVIVQPALGAGLTKAAQRAAGTVLGFAIAIAIGSILGTGPLLYALGTAFLMAALVVMLQGRPYWVYAALLTPAIVLLESAGSTVDQVAKERLAATLAGVAITILVLLVLAPFAKHFAAPLSEAVPMDGANAPGH